MIDKHEITPARRPHLRKKGGRLWFTREDERRFYFVLTLIMLIVGILYKIGVI